MAATALSLIATSGAGAYYQFITCSSRGKTASFRVHVNARRYVYKIDYRLRGGPVSSQNIIAYREAIQAGNGSYVMNTYSWPTIARWWASSDGRWRTRDVPDVSPFGWRRHWSGQNWYYRHRLQTGFRWGGGCSAYDVP